MSREGETMAKLVVPTNIESLPLPKRIEDEVKGWVAQGYYPPPSETSRQLLAHWFRDDHESGQTFHPCQRRAIETAIYLHEVAAVRTLRQLYEKFAPERLNLFPEINKEVSAIPFMKYCFKMATGSGKTWVLAALVIWQYFNAINEEKTAPFSSRFLIVTPGVEVLNRIIDSFKGRRDPKTGKRNPETSDYKSPLFIPDDFRWRSRFLDTGAVLEPSDIRNNTSPPDGPFVAITNWQQFALGSDNISLAEQIGLSIPEEPRGEVVADFLTTHPDLIVFNDEAHHVHAEKNAKKEDLVWRKFMDVLNSRMAEKHGKNRGLFMQVDFSATPFFGSGKKRVFFPHIVYDYDLRAALNDMLVKQLFLEERQAISKKQQVHPLEFRAIRDHADKGKRGDVLELHPDQVTTLSIGLSKLDQLRDDFAAGAINRKPVLMILCEETSVADLVYDYFLTREDSKGSRLKKENLLLFHSELTKDNHGCTLDEARGTTLNADPSIPTLNHIDDDAHPLRIVISVLALREGFDKNNICVIAVLRATEADLLLEQIVGRGLRLMFPEYKYPGAIQDEKRAAFKALKDSEEPHSSLDFLYIVEHPKFRDFYNSLKRDGYLIATGDSTKTKSTGDIIPVPVDPARVPERDIAWPFAVHDESVYPPLSEIDPMKLQPTRLDIQMLRHTANTPITDRHMETDTRAKTWTLGKPFFDYSHFLASIATTIALADKGRWNYLSARRAEIADLLDQYVTHRLFGKTIDFTLPENYKLLDHPQLQIEIVATLRSAIIALLGKPMMEVKSGEWTRLSKLAAIFARSNSALIVKRSIYPRMPVAARAGGLERKVMGTLLDKSPEVMAWCKLQKKHGLIIPYRDPSGLLRSYEVDFVLRTKDSCYILETKNDDDLKHPTVGIKAQAAITWCKTVSNVPLPSVASASSPMFPAQPLQWEYLLLSESLYDTNAGSSFSALLPFMQSLRDSVVAQQFHGSLFVT
jgi:type III restriction enzyme